MDKTYAETMGEQPFDWNLALDKAIKTPPSKFELETMYKMASQWKLCACGNQCAIIPRHPQGYHTYGAPQDFELMQLGYRFHGQISGHQFLRAKATLAEIEARSAIVIQETLAGLNQP